MLLLLVHAAATLFMFGVIAMVQWVHYPLFDIVGDLRFPAYHKAHMQRIGQVVMIPMTIELVTAVALIFWRPGVIPIWLVWLGLALVVAIWLSTLLLQVPHHNDLTKGFDSVALSRLVGSNWIRTVMWCLRSAVILFMLHLATSSTS